MVVRLGEEQQRELAGIEGERHIAYPVQAGIQFLVGFVDDRPVACGALQPLKDGIGEIKRMYVRRPYRRQGLSRLILAALEEYALQRGLHTVRLETGVQLDAALALYRSADYRPIPRFGEYAHNPLSVCFEKSLTAVELSVVELSAVELSTVEPAAP